MRIVLLLALLSALTGCGVSGLRHRHDDNPQVRTLQEASISGYGDRPIAGQSVDEFFTNKVGLIVVKGSSLPVGRATPISPDGYYLTAWHVVEDGDFRLSNSVSSANPFQVEEFPGRVVWHEKVADLAVVKFGYRPSALFKAQGPPVGKGETVFSGASGMNSGIRFTRKNDSGRYDVKELLKSAFGNGQFQTAGKVTSIRALAGGSSRRVYQSTLVGRGGMSGAPVVNRQGHLVGIITGGQAKLFSEPATLFSMLDPTALDAIIHEDRRRQ